AEFRLGDRTLHHARRTMQPWPESVSLLEVSGQARLSRRGPAEAGCALVVHQAPEARSSFVQRAGNIQRAAIRLSSASSSLAPVSCWASDGARVAYLIIRTSSRRPMTGGHAQ